MAKERIELTTEELWKVIEFVTIQTKRGVIRLDDAEKHVRGIFEMLEENR